MTEFSALAARDYLLLAAGFVAAYLVLSLLPLVNLRRRGSLARKSAVDSGKIPEAWNPAVHSALDPSKEAAAGSLVAQLERKSAADVPAESAFARELAQSSLGLEVERLRREIAQLREELTRLAEGMRQLKSAHNVAPFYSEAMTLAQRGEPAAGIASQCGISLGEAELVAALARNEPGTQDAATKTAVTRTWQADGEDYGKAI